MEENIVALKYSGNIEAELLNTNARDNSNDPFIEFKKQAIDRGFRVCESGPLVRSSYRADEQAALIADL